MRIGFGTDVHRYTDKPDRLLILAGFPVAGHRGLDADSDGDVAIHAICNALSSSVGGKSLGFYTKDLITAKITDSSRYLEVVLATVREKGFVVGNVSLAFECTAPHIDPLVDGMKACLARLLSIDTHQIGITATTAAGSANDFVRVYATVLLIEA